jgi:hypothetical protein
MQILVESEDIGQYWGCTDPDCAREDAAKTGLYDKYTVLQNGEEQDGCFVLKPESDAAALKALRTYANETNDLELRSELRGWIMAIEEGDDGR